MASTGVGYHVSNIAWQILVSGIMVKYSMASTECNISVSMLYVSTYISSIKSRITVIRHETMVIEHEILKGMYSQNDKIEVC